MSKFLRFVAWTSLIIAALVGVLRLTVIRWWQLPIDDPYLQASISPTLSGGDWVILWRATPASYGDLVLCPEPKTNRVVIGRILAEQGDHLKIEGSNVTVNKQVARTEGGCDKFRGRDPSTGIEVDQSCSLETVGSHSHERGNAVPEESKPLVEQDVPDGRVFLVSDNREFSWDSREFGTVDRSTCSETVVFRLISKDGFFDVPKRLSLIH